MAWRPTAYLMEGQLDNTKPGKVTGWMKFAGLSENVVFDLEGDFHRDIRGTSIRFVGDGGSMDTMEAASYMSGMSLQQTGKAGDITAGRQPQDYVDYPYIEWYSDSNGRVVLELSPEQITVIGKPVDASTAEPVSRDEQNQQLFLFMGDCARDINIR